MQAAWRVLFIFSALDARGTVRSTSKGWIEKNRYPLFCTIYLYHRIRERNRKYRSF